MSLGESPFLNHFTDFKWVGNDIVVLLPDVGAIYWK